MPKIAFVRHVLPDPATLNVQTSPIGGKIYPEDGVYATLRVPVPEGSRFLSVVESGVYGRWDLETEDPRVEFGIPMPWSTDTYGSIQNPFDLPNSDGYVNLLYRFLLFPSNSGSAEGSVTIAVILE